MHVPNGHCSRKRRSRSCSSGASHVYGRMEQPVLLLLRGYFFSETWREFISTSTTAALAVLSFPIFRGCVKWLRQIILTASSPGFLSQLSKYCEKGREAKEGGTGRKKETISQLYLFLT